MTSKSRARDDEATNNEKSVMFGNKMNYVSNRILFKRSNIVPNPTSLEGSAKTLSSPVPDSLPSSRFALNQIGESNGEKACSI